MKALFLSFPKMVLDIDFDPILTELWPLEWIKLNHGKCSKQICLCEILLLFLAFSANQVFKKSLIIISPFSVGFKLTKTVLDHQNMTKYMALTANSKFYFKMKASNFRTR